MKNEARKQTLIGGAVAAAGVLFLVSAYGSGADRATPSGQGFEVAAQFNRSDGLAAGAQVRIAGMPVGRVVRQTLTPDFRAVVIMRIAPGVNLPTDSAALIQSDGLLGAKYIELQPGGSETSLTSGSRITFTQDALLVDDLLERILAQAQAKARATSPQGAKPAAAAQTAPKDENTAGDAEPAGTLPATADPKAAADEDPAAANEVVSARP